MRRNSGRIRSSSTLFLLAAAFWCAGADAQILVHFDLPGQPLARSLTAIGTATNTDVGFSASQVAGLLAPPLKADLTVDGALQHVLAGTGLRPKHLDAHTIVIAAMGLRTADSGELRPSQTRTFTPEDIGDQIVMHQAGGVANSADSTSSSNAGKEDLDEIIVTGTHIHGTNNKINPVIVIDRDQIDRSGYSSTADLFRSLPQNFQAAGASEDGWLNPTPTSPLNTDFGTGINLRGLGPSSTLVLLNGHRLAPSSSGSFVDVSQIPLSAVDRVEILTDGSSAIYGSDAVGGVVNIILKKDYQGADTSVRYGATTSGGRDELLVSQSLGSSWSGGNVVGTLQFQRQGALPATDRPDSASNLTNPNDLFPSTRSYDATLNGRQTLFDGLEFYGDLLASKREPTQFESFPFPPLGNYITATNTGAESIDVSPGLRFSLSPAWTIELNGLYGYQKSITSLNEAVPGFAFTDTNIGLDNRFTEKSADLVTDGRLGSTAAGPIAVAFGASYRTEDFSELRSDVLGGVGPPIITPLDIDRHVTAEFLELHLPILGPANQIPLAQDFELSGALRRDDYSDFGAATNPHLGLRWAPFADISVRASYGKSFRAPNAYEESSENQQPEIYTEDFLSPTGHGMVPVLVLAGSKILTAERARTLDFGVEYKPLDLRGFSASLDYYDIRYSNRIIYPITTENFLQQAANYGSLISPVASDAAAQALVNAITATGGQFFDFTNTGTGVTGVRYLFDSRQQNAALVQQSGIDLTSKFLKTFGAYTWTSQINVAFTNKIDTQFSQGASFVNSVNTFGNPVKWRARFDSTWGSAAYSISGALNAVGSYIDTNDVGNPPIASWTTVDLNATLHADAFFQSYVWRGVSFSLIVLNALNREPPFVPNLNAENPASYDATNANPLGRFVAVAVRKKW
jgi:outer membrane receptor protein involved in Fe transport